MYMYIIYTGIPGFTELHFIELHRCCVFYKLKARPSTNKKKKKERKKENYNSIYSDILLQWSETKPTIPLRCACMYVFLY